MPHLNIKKFTKKNIIILIIIIFIIYKSLYLLGFNTVIWDEASYVGMGKYLLSNGNSGIIEPIRPLTLSFLIGLMWVIGLKSILFYKLLILGFSISSIFLVYKIGTHIFNHKTGVTAAILLALTPIFNWYSLFILTGIPSLFLVLLSIYVIYKKKYFYGGIFGALAFVTRFTQLIYLVSIGIYFLIKIIREHKNRKKVFYDSLFFCLGSLSVLIIYFTINYIIYNQFTSSWMHAAFRPFYYMIWNYQYTQSIGAYNYPLFFYVIELVKSNPLVLFIFGIFLVKNKNKKSNLLIILSISYLIFFSILNNKQTRFILVFLPFILILASKGLINSLNKITKNYKNILFIGITLLIAIALLLTIPKPIVKEKPIMFEEYYGFLEKYPIKGSALLTDPIPAAYYDQSIDIAYFDIPTLKSKLKSKNFDVILFSETSFPCPKEDYVCESEKNKIMQDLVSKYELVFSSNYFGSEYYIFSNIDYIPKIDNSNLLHKYNLTKNIILSTKPYDKLPVLIVLEDFPSMNDEFNDIWNKQEYEYFLDYFKDHNIPVTINVIPSHIESLNSSNINKLKEGNFTISQNGYDHTSYAKESFDEELESIGKGKEIIKNKLNVTPTIFTPPFYASSQNKIKALDMLGFNIYISNIGDQTTFPHLRLDQKITLIKNWNNKEHKTFFEIQEEVNLIDMFDDYLMVSIYYYMYDTNLNSFQDFMNLTNNKYYMDVKSYSNWIKFIQNVSVDTSNNIITVVGPKSNYNDKITLLFNSGGNYTLNSNYSINIKNTNTKPITVCIKQCQKLNLGEIAKV